MDSSDMSLLVAVMNDEAKSARLEEIMTAQKRAEKTMADAQALMQKAEEHLDEGRKMIAVSDAKLNEARDLVDSIAEKEAELGRVQDAHTAEKGAFEKVRMAVRREHHDRNTSLVLRAVDVEKRERSLAQRETVAGRREAYLVATKESLERKHERLHLALADNDSEG